MLDPLRLQAGPRPPRRPGRLRIHARNSALTGSFRPATRVAVAGAGIGGLAAALALAEAGCAVDVFERAPALEPVGAGVQISPNAALVLRRLGVLDVLGAAAVPLAEVLMRRARDGAALARVPLGPAAEARYGAPFLSALRADLQAALLAAAAPRPAVALHLGRGVEGYARGPRGVSLRFAPGPGGDEAGAGHDALVGADGIRSAVRLGIAGVDVARGSGRAAYRATVPREAAGAADAEALLPRSNLWLGRSAHLVHYPVAGGALVNVVAIVDEGSAPAAPPRDAGSWSEPAAAAAVERRFAGWAAPARRLIAAAPGWRRWPLFDRPPLPRWSDGPVTLLGDAAHPMLPFLAQGAAQSIEDAAVLADSVAMCCGNLTAAFSTYEALRRPRTSRVQAQSARQGSIYHLARPLSLARDLALRNLGPARLAAGLDWLYDAPAEVRRFAGTPTSA